MPSALKPVPHGEGLPVPDTHMKNPNARSSREESESESVQLMEEYIPESHERLHHLVQQKELKVLVCDLKLCKQRSELLDSRLKQWNNGIYKLKVFNLLLL